MIMRAPLFKIKVKYLCLPANTSLLWCLSFLWFHSWTCSLFHYIINILCVKQIDPSEFIILETCDCQPSLHCCSAKLGIFINLPISISLFRISSMGTSRPSGRFNWYNCSTGNLWIPKNQVMAIISPSAATRSGIGTAQPSIRSIIYMPPLVAVGRAIRNIKKHTIAERIVSLMGNNEILPCSFWRKSLKGTYKYVNESFHQ